MDDQSPPESHPSMPSKDTPQLPMQVPRHPLNVAFFNDQGLRAGWRIVIYLFQILLLSVVLNFLLGRVFHLPKNATPPMWQMMLLEGLSLLIVFLPALVMARIEARPAGA